MSDIKKEAMNIVLKEAQALGHSKLIEYALENGATDDTFAYLRDLDKYSVELSDKLAKEGSEHFNEWWDADKFDWDASYMLALYCEDHIDKWWDADKFDWKDPHAVSNLFTYNIGKKELWRDAVIKMLLDDGEDHE